MRTKGTRTGVAAVILVAAVVGVEIVAVMEAGMAAETGAGTETEEAAIAITTTGEKERDKETIRGNENI